ncbi:MAG: phenylalanine--tRNA ligase subunit beta [Nocardioidaceae bacterium]|nr:phenylalanine--tRNA ligase subunit beta [Nocardioidaceae bacterium]
MRVPIAWLREYVALPESVSAVDLAAKLTAYDLKLEEIDSVGAGIEGPIVVGRVVSADKEPQSNGKTINWCQVDVGPEHNVGGEPRGIVCGAHNFVAGDLVVVSLPGAVLPGDFAIAARKTYGHISDGMICSGAELGIAGDPAGIIVIEPTEASVGDDAIELLGLRAEVLDLEVNPDRAYALSLRGVARDTALAFGVAFSDPAAIEAPRGGEAYPVVVEDAVACPVFTARVVTGFDSSRPTPSWMARRIELAGMRSISLAVDITNYVMLELGQPIHGYDRATLQGPIVVRKAVEGEKITTLDDVTRTLTAADLLITDDSGPIGLAAVMGGQHTELTATTTDIVIEAAHFDPPMVARTARLMKLPSEASKRFERGVDPELPAIATQRAAELFAAYGGATIQDGLTYVGEAPAPATITIAADLPAKVTGIAIDTATSISALEANGCSVRVEGDHLVVTPPTWRPDLTDPYDLAEEVLRVVGYDQVPSVLPPAPAGRGLTKAQRLRRRVGMVLAGAGLIEVKTFPFAGPIDMDKLGLPADDARRRQVLLENPLSAEEPGMTTTLLPALLKTLVLNIGRGHSDVAIFETGRVFLPKDGALEAPIYGVDSRPTSAQLAALEAALPAQPQRVGIVMAGERVHSGWWGKGRAVSWADAIAAVLEVARALHVPVEVEAIAYAPWHPGRCAQFVLDGTIIGHAGELHPRVVKSYGLPARTVAAEFDLDALIAAAPDLGDAPSFSTFPVAKEDVALVVDADITAESVARALQGASDLIESVRLFDVYTGDQVPTGAKSLAFALRLRAPDRTLTDDEIKTARDAAVAAAHTATGATQRT